MRIHVNVNIESDRFLNGLYEAIDIIDRVAQYPDNDVIIDFSGTRFVTPLFVVPLMVYKVEKPEQTGTVRRSRVGHF